MVDICKAARQAASLPALGSDGPGFKCSSATVSVCGPRLSHAVLICKMVLRTCISQNHCEDVQGVCVKLGRGVWEGSQGTVSVVMLGDEPRRAEES